MKAEDLIIASCNNCYLITVKGRANFEYAVPVRELVKDLEFFDRFAFELSDCVTMDSTFMGVLTMLALRGIRKQNPVQLWNASPEVTKLLEDLGVAKLFNFCTGTPESIAESGSACCTGTRLDMAETVAEAHRTLVEAEPANAATFENVIKFADEDVKKLREDADSK